MALDSKLRGRKFDYWPFLFNATTVQANYSQTDRICSPCGIIWYWPKAVMLCSWERNRYRRLWAYITVAGWLSICQETGISSGATVCSLSRMRAPLALVHNAILLIVNCCFSVKWCRQSACDGAGSRSQTISLLIQYSNDTRNAAQSQCLSTMKRILSLLVTESSAVTEKPRDALCRLAIFWK